MARYGVYRLTSGALVVDCQADLLSHLRTRLVAPLLPPDELPAALPRLHPHFEIDGRRWLLATHLAAAVPTTEIAEEVGSLAPLDGDIATALDMLLIGF